MLPLVNIYQVISSEMKYIVKISCKTWNIKVFLDMQAACDSAQTSRINKTYTKGIEIVVNDSRKIIEIFPLHFYLNTETTCFKC